nr:MFS transporter [uncultured Sphingomonas sp.]
MADRWGRVTPLVIAKVLAIVGAALVMFAAHFEVILAGRFFVGAAYGIDFAIAMAVLNGTKRSPASPAQEVGWNYVNGGGATTASITCPANGVIVGFAVAGFDNPTFNAGTTVVGRSGSVYVLSRTTSGPIGFTNGGGYGGIIAAAYEKSQ